MKQTIKTLPQHILHHSLCTPDKTAIITDNGCLTYAQLAEKMSSVCIALRQRGVTAGTAVVSVASHSMEYVAVCYGIHLAGAIHVPVENRIPANRLSEIAADVHAGLIIAPTNPDCGIHHTTADELLTPCCTDELIASDAADDCAEILYTTGTTGKSKGVMISSANLASYVATANPTFGLDENTVFLVCTPLNHAGGIRRLHMTMAAGGTAVLLEGVYNLKKFFAVIEQHGVNATYLPPASIRLLLSLAASEFKKLNGKLKFIYTASAPFPSADMETVAAMMTKTKLFQGYGSSETGCVSNYNYNAPGADLTCLGHPHKSVQVRLLAEDGAVVTEPNVNGHICVKSPMNMLGYLNEPELTASILQDGWIRSSDLGYFDKQGRLFFAGRGDDVINVGGFKVAPTEVESAALHCPGVKDCICIGVQTRMGTALKLLVAMADGHPFDPKAIAAVIRPRVEPYKIPSAIEQIDEVPRTYNGKINRKAFR